ncbi:MAG TPA: phosphomannomutase/phosphoglucomutase [Acidimicrobiales bacterium]|nr:phosphomannomutase/phosphoglucomutase [Acidimicrobiales bacterium]
MSVIFKAYDVRGTYPDQLDENVARAVGSAFADHVAAPSVLIARDMRASGVALSAAFAEGVRARGVEVVDIGLASTDLLYFASGYLDAPGAMFTASHNPAAYNGIKLCRAGARPIGTDTGLADIEAATVAYLDRPAQGELAALVERSVLDEWVDHVHSFVDVEALTRLRIVADTANGMGGYVVPAVFADLPFDVEILYPELDGTFPNHPADPLNPDNIVDLQRRVLETGADVGLAFDGDADRVFLVDERAQPLSGSTTTAMVASVMLERHPGATILYNLICSRAVPEVIDECAGVGVRTRVGHSYIKQVMADTGAVFGGEHSGHYYYRDNYRADSGIITAMVVLELLSRQRRPLSEVAAPFVRYASSGEINTRVDDPAAVVAAISERMRAAGTNVDELDGLTVEHDTWWFNLRPSNTEPLLRLNVEAEDAAACEAHVAEVLALIKEMA